MNPRTRLEAFLERLPPAGRVLVGFSGGLDSTVLLHALSVLEPRPPLHAIHIDHGLSPGAGRWAAHCEALCRDWDIPLAVRRVEAAAAPGESPEAAARRARYEAFEALVQPGDCLLIAHHRDDQAETVLLQLLRGAGPAGLAAMPALAAFGPGRLGRPLLECSRDELHDYARRHALSWVEDDSNADHGFSRNYLRHRVMPAIAGHWPGCAVTLSRAARVQARAAAVLEEVGAQDCAAAQTAGGTLSIAGLQHLSLARRANAVRCWLRERGAPVPGEAVLEQILGAAAARGDAAPRVAWQGVELRRYRDGLYLLRPPADEPAPEYRWPHGRPLHIEPLSLTLDRERLQAQGLALERAAGPLTVRFRRGGERLRLPGREHRHSLKKLLQARGVPPWLRDRLPLLYHGDDLIAVLGLEPPLIAAGWER